MCVRAAQRRRRVYLDSDDIVDIVDNDGDTGTAAARAWPCRIARSRRTSGGVDAGDCAALGFFFFGALLRLVWGRSARRFAADGVGRPVYRRCIGTAAAE